MKRMSSPETYTLTNLRRSPFCVIRWLEAFLDVFAGVALGWVLHDVWDQVRRDRRPIR